MKKTVMLPLGDEYTLKFYLVHHRSILKLSDQQTADGKYEVKFAFSVAGLKPIRAIGNNCYLALKGCMDQLRSTIVPQYNEARENLFASQKAGKTI